MPSQKHIVIREDYIQLIKTESMLQIIYYVTINYIRCASYSNNQQNQWEHYPQCIALMQSILKLRHKFDVIIEKHN